MVELLSNTVDIDRVREDMDYSSAVAFIDSLDDEELTALDSVDFLSGRAAYSPQTLKQLTERMLNTDDDLHEARKAVLALTTIGSRQSIRSALRWGIPPLIVS